MVYNFTMDYQFSYHIWSHNYIPKYNILARAVSEENKRL